MKINFPKFRKSTRSYKTITQACQDMQAAMNPSINKGTHTAGDYVSFLNRETHNKSWFKKMSQTLQILFSSKF